MKESRTAKKPAAPRKAAQPAAPRPPELVIRIETTGYTSTEMQWIVEELSYNIAELTNWRPKKGLILDKLHNTGRVIGEWETK